MDDDGRTFSIGLVPTIAALAGFGLLVGLGTWQYQKYRVKLEREQLREERLDEPPARVRSLNELEQRDLNYRRVKIEADLIAETRIVVKHRHHRGDPGSWLLQPLQLPDGGRLLVNRGWIPFQKAKGELGDLAEPPDELPLVGLLYRLPNVVADDDARATLESGDRRLNGERTEWDTFDATAMYSHLDGETPGAPWVLVLGPRHTDDRYPIASFEHVTEPYLTSTRHLSYAVFWYAVAAGLVGLYLAAGFGVLRRRRRGRGHVPSGDD